MRIDICYSGGLLTMTLNFSGESKNYSFAWDDDINLTALVIDISESESIVEIKPDDFEAFRSANDCESKEILKVAEYIYKIVEAFNEAYSEVYPDHIRKHGQTAYVPSSSA